MGANLTCVGPLCIRSDTAGSHHPFSISAPRGIDGITGIQVIEGVHNRLAVDGNHLGSNQEESLTPRDGLGFIGEEHAEAGDIAQHGHFVDLFGILAGVVATNQKRLIVIDDG